jgi:tetratricopeptide (TPR) repeat protein
MLKIKFWTWRVVVLTLALVALPFGISYAFSGHSRYFESARGYSQKGDWKNAIPEYQKAVEAVPDDALAWANFGVALSESGAHKEALLAYEKALQLKYDGAVMRFNRGLSFAKLNLLEEAEKEFKVALDLDPRLPKAEFNLGLIYKIQGRNEEASALVDKLYLKNPELAKQLFDQVPPKYKVAAVDGGGKLTGRITFNGPPPPPRTFHLVHMPNIEFCSRISDGQGHRLVYDFVISETSGLKDVVVTVLGVQKGKPFPPSQKNLNFKIDRCHVDQYVIGINNGDNIVVDNIDPVTHEIATYEIDYVNATQKDFKAVPPKTTQMRSAFVHSRTKEFYVRCNLHEFIEMRGLMVNNPYYTITNADGRFAIDDLPPGTYEVMAWHPFIKTVHGTVTVEPGKEAKLELTFDGKEERRRIYEDDIKGYRFQPWYDSNRNFYGGERKDDAVEVLQNQNPPPSTGKQNDDRL